MDLTQEIKINDFITQVSDELKKHLDLSDKRLDNLEEKVMNFAIEY